MGKETKDYNDFFPQRRVNSYFLSQYGEIFLRTHNALVNWYWENKIFRLTII